MTEPRRFTVLFLLSERGHCTIAGNGTQYPDRVLIRWRRPHEDTRRDAEYRDMATAIATLSEIAPVRIVWHSPAYWDTDLSISGARRAVHAHERRTDAAGWQCSAGCGRWPCAAFLLALDTITSNDHMWRHIR